MKATQQQRLTLALQAAANIVPVQFQLEYYHFSPALRLWRIIASAVVFLVFIAVAMFSVALNVFYIALLALPVAYLFFQSLLSVWVWPKPLLHEKIRQWHHCQPVQIDGATIVVIQASQHPCDLHIYVSSGLAAVASFDQISATGAALAVRENVLEAILQSVEECALAILPAAASLSPPSAASSLRVLR